MNDSPLATAENLLAGDILLQGGDGGNGSSGGQGGSVANFINNPTTTDNPAVLSVLAGSGGRGISGPGGDGGNVSNIKTPTRGIPNPFSASAPPATVYGFNRILAGNGGLSAGGVGGAGNRPSQLPSGGNSWQHNPQHRGGAPYGDRGTANRFGGSARGDSLANRQASARQQVGRQGVGCGARIVQLGEADMPRQAVRTASVVPFPPPR